MDANSDKNLFKKKVIKNKVIFISVNTVYQNILHNFQLLNEPLLIMLYLKQTFIEISVINYPKYYI